MIKAIKRFFEDRAFEKACKLRDKQIAPYIVGYANGAYVLNVEKVVEDWQNEWKIIHFSFRHIELKGLPKGGYTRLHPTSAKAVIKALGLKKYGLLCQDGFMYRLEEWRPSKQFYSIEV